MITQTNLNQVVSQLKTNRVVSFKKIGPGMGQFASFEQLSPHFNNAPIKVVDTSMNPLVNDLVFTKPTSQVEASLRSRSQFDQFLESHSDTVFVVLSSTNKLTVISHG